MPERERERERDRQTDRQTDRQRQRQTDRQTDSVVGIPQMLKVILNSYWPNIHKGKGCCQLCTHQ